MRKNCSNDTKHPLIVVEEGKRRALFKNVARENYRITRIDGCLICEGPRADYMMCKPGVGSVFIELKGKDVEHACRQLQMTVDNKEVKGLRERELGFLIVCSRYPRFDSYVLKAKQEFARKYRAGLRVVCDRGDFVFEELLRIREN